MTHHERPRGKKINRHTPYPEAYKRDIAKVRARVDRRPVASAPVRLDPVENENGGVDHLRWGPLFSGDDDYFWLKLHDAFGTRHSAVVDVFLGQMIELCGGNQATEGLLNAAIAIVGSTKPKNEVEAMLAAQMVAVNHLTMRAAAAASTHSRYVPEREAKLVFRGARTFAEQIDVMARLKGAKPRTQEIHVHQHLHHHDERRIVEGDVHVHRPGGGDFGAPTRDANGGRKSADTNSIGEHPGRPALRSPDADGCAMPGPEGEGPTQVSPSWLRAWVGRAARGGQRLLQARRLDSRGQGNAPTASGGHAQIPEDQA